MQASDLSVRCHYYLHRCIIIIIIVIIKANIDVSIGPFGKILLPFITIMKMMIPMLNIGIIIFIFKITKLINIKILNITKNS